MKVYTFMKDATIRTNSMFATKLQSHLVEATRIVFVLRGVNESKNLCVFLAI